MAAGCTRRRGFRRSCLLQGTTSSRSECGSPLFVQQISPRNPASTGWCTRMAGRRVSPSSPKRTWGSGSHSGGWRICARPPNPFPSPGSSSMARTPSAPAWPAGCSRPCWRSSAALPAATGSSARSSSKSAASRCAGAGHGDPGGCVALGSRWAAKEDLIVLCFGCAGSSTARRGRCHEPVPPTPCFKPSAINEQRACADSATGLFGALQGGRGGLFAPGG